MSPNLSIAVVWCRLAGRLFHQHWYAFVEQPVTCCKKNEDGEGIGRHSRSSLKFVTYMWPVQCQPTVTFPVGERPAQNHTAWRRGNMGVTTTCENTLYNLFGSHNNYVSLGHQAAQFSSTFANSRSEKAQKSEFGVGYQRSVCDKRRVTLALAVSRHVSFYRATLC